MYIISIANVNYSSNKPVLCIMHTCTSYIQQMHNIFNTYFYLNKLLHVWMLNPIYTLANMTRQY